MSNRNKFTDRTPFIKDAGISTAVEGLSADNSLRQELYIKKNYTPEKIKKFRKSERDIIGRKQLHHGIYDDPKDYENIIHGKKTLGSEHVNDCIKGTNLTGINHFINEIKEQNYASFKRESLGKGFKRNYVFSDKCKEDNFRFGNPTTGFYNAKDLIYDNTKFEEDLKTKKMYNITHNYTSPGEQKDREYIWPVDKDKYVFGKKDNTEFDGVKKSLRTDLLFSEYPNTNIGSKRLEDYRQATNSLLGKSKFKGTMDTTKIPENFTFGSKSIKNTDSTWNIAQCIHGNIDSLKPEYVTKDADLGKNILYNSKNSRLQPKSDIDPNRYFGVPSVRSDLKCKEKESICNITNYGNEKDAYELLYPHRFNTRGLDDVDFEQEISKENLKILLKKNRHNISDEELSFIYDITSRNCNKKVTYNNIMETIRFLKKDYNKYRAIMY